MAGTRPRRLGLAFAVSLTVAIAAAGAIVGPRLAPSLLARDGALNKAQRKLRALRAFSLFRARGDRAVLHAGDPPGARADKRAAPRP
jgi:hypothetical protein